MKTLAITICAAVLLWACGGKKDDNNTEPAKDNNAQTTNGGETKKDDGNTAASNAKPPTEEEMMKMWNDFKTPGDMHKWMAKFDGTWEAEVSQWMDPAQPPAKAKAVSVSSMSLGGRYQTTKFTSTMMGQPMEGMSTMGYDNGKKMFVSTWVDNLGSGIVYMSGTWDEATKTLNLKGRQTDPMSGKDSDIREVMKVLDDNTYVMEMYGAGMDGKEMKFMEGTFKRKK